jgi:hypothetical protein
MLFIFTFRVYLFAVPGYSLAPFMKIMNYLKRAGGRSMKFRGFLLISLGALGSF